MKIHTEITQIRLYRTERTGECECVWLFHNKKDVSWRRTNRHGFDECSLSEACGEVKSTEWVWEHDYFCVCRHSRQSRHLPSTPVQSHMVGAPRLPHCEPPSSAKPVFWCHLWGERTSITQLPRICWMWINFCFFFVFSGKKLESFSFSCRRADGILMVFFLIYQLFEDTKWPLRVMFLG